MRKVFRGDLKRFKRLFDLYQKQNRSFEVQRSGSLAKIILDDRTMIFRDKTENTEIPILCKMVIKDVKKWLIDKKQIDLENKKVVFHNKNNICDNVSNVIFGYDIISCYWNIALRENIISKKTFDYGVNNKSGRTLAIGNLNKKVYRTIVINNSKENTIIESEYKNAYNFIIKEVQKMYKELNEKFENQILAWRTDCIYLPSGYEKQLNNYFNSKKLKIKSKKYKVINCKRNKVSVEDLDGKKVIVWNV